MLHRHLVAAVAAVADAVAGAVLALTVAVAVGVAKAALLRKMLKPPQPRPPLMWLMCVLLQRHHVPMTMHMHQVLRTYTSGNKATS
jgi:hypothetical protein